MIKLTTRSADHRADLIKREEMTMDIFMGGQVGLSADCFPMVSFFDPIC